MALTKPTMQPAPMPQKSQREVELERIATEQQQQIEVLTTKAEIANLKDDVFFRIELLRSLNNIAVVFQNFLAELKPAEEEQSQ